MKGRCAEVVLLVLLGLHLLLGIVRLPGKVCQRRIDDVAAYRRDGAARFLLGSAKLAGAAELEWLLTHTGPDAVVLWRWPADGALEFAATLLAPRLVVDERKVAADAGTFAGRPIAHGTTPDGANGQIVLQGTAQGGLRLTARGPR
jgi:hypothetical protein